MSRSVSIVIPVYNAALTLETLHERVTAELESEGIDFEIILVDDFSLDGSWQVVEKLSAADKRVTGIKLGRNFGQHNALLCGIRQASKDVTVTLDDDLQHPPSAIKELLETLDQGFDVVYGTPMAKQHGFLRNIASGLTKMTLKSAMGIETAGKVSALRAFKTDLRVAFEHFRSPSVSIDVLLTWATSNFGNISVQHMPRTIGQSNYTFGKLVAHAFDLMTGFSSLPLRFASVVGFFFTLFGFGTLLWVVVRYFVEGTNVPGFAFLASIISIFSGAQMFALGIFGEYLARIHFRTLDRPPYVVTLTTDPARQAPY